MNSEKEKAIGQLIEELKPLWKKHLDMFNITENQTKRQFIELELELTFKLGFIDGQTYTFSEMLKQAERREKEEKSN